MIVDGKQIARDILVDVAQKISALESPLRLVIITCAPNFETQAYLELKKHKATKLGVVLEVKHFEESSTTEELVAEIKSSVSHFDGILVQLPLPKNIDTQAVLETIPASHDVDAFSYSKNEVKVLPPVVGAIDAIAKRHNFDWTNKKVVVFGSGKLVGAPIHHYLLQKQIQATVITEATEAVASLTKDADVIISGVGKPNIILASMVKEGVVVFDAGASEDGGILVGDAELKVADKAAIFTPVPGGIGPITIAILFRNLLDLRLRQ